MELAKLDLVSSQGTHTLIMYISKAGYWICGPGVQYQSG